LGFLPPAGYCCTLAFREIKRRRESAGFEEISHKEVT